MTTLNFLIEPNTFTQYQIDERSFLLTELQQAQIQNQIAFTAQLQLNLRYDPLNPTDFGLQHARFVGCIEAYQYLLDLSKSNSETQLQEQQS